MYGKSASAAGASMTPSSVACVCAVIEVIRVRPPAGAQLIATHETGARARLHARSSTPYSKYPSPAAVASDEKQQSRAPMKPAAPPRQTDQPAGARAPSAVLQADPKRVVALVARSVGAWPARTDGRLPRSCGSAGAEFVVQHDRAAGSVVG